MALTIALAGSAIAGRATPAQGQEARSLVFPSWSGSAAPPPPSRVPPPDSLQDRDTAGMIMGGVLGASVGLLGGAFLGYHIDMAGSPCYCDDPGLGGVIVGSFVGSVVLTPALTHLMGGKHGSVVAGIVATTLTSAGIVFAAATSEGPWTGVIYTLPLVQIVTAVLTERATAPRNR